MIDRSANIGAALRRNQRGFIINPFVFGGGGGGGDPNFASVISLLHFNGTDGSTTITDQIAGRTWSVSGTTALSTTNPKFGSACLSVPNSGKATSNVAAGDAFGTGDFTVELWIRPTSWGTDIIYDTRTAATEVRPSIYYTGGTLRYYVNGADRITGGSLSTGVYAHIALARSGTSTKMFIDGVQTGSTYSDSNNYVNDRMTWGDASYTAGNSIDGRIDEARVTKGVARYTTTFTPPTVAFPDS